MPAIEKTVRAFFDTRNPSGVIFYLPDRVPDLDWATTTINTLRNHRYIDKLTCRPNSFELEALLAPNHDVTDILTEIIVTVMELLGVDSVHKFAINVKRSLTSMKTEDLLVSALKELAVREWTNIHSLSLEMARDGRAELNRRLETLQATERTQAEGWTDAEKALDDNRVTLASTRQSYKNKRGGADLNDDGLIALGQVALSLSDVVSGLEKSLEVDFATLSATRQEIVALTSTLEEAKAKVNGIENLTCPRYKVAITKWGRVALFTLKTRLGEDEESEGNLDAESVDDPDNATDKMSTDEV